MNEAYNISPLFATVTSQQTRGLCNERLCIAIPKQEIKIEYLPTTDIGRFTNCELLSESFITEKINVIQSEKNHL